MSKEDLADTGFAETGQPDSPFSLQNYFPYRINTLANTISKAIAQIYITRFNLTRPECRILASLSDKTGLTAQDIAHITILDKMQVSRAVAQLEADGLVKRKQDQHDRRNKILHLTQRGRDLFDKIVPLARARENNILSALSADERANLATIMNKLEARAVYLLQQEQTE